MSFHRILSLAQENEFSGVASKPGTSNYSSTTVRALSVGAIPDHPSTALERLSATSTEEVDKMIRWGAVVDAADRDAFIEYLSTNFPAAKTPLEMGVRCLKRKSSDVSLIFGCTFAQNMD